MKKKVIVSMLILIVAIMCCGCVGNTDTSSSGYNSQFEQEYERDITYKKDADDHTPKVYITEYGKRYHKPYCSHAKNIYIFLTVRQATSWGYTACYYCCY